MFCDGKLFFSSYSPGWEMGRVGEMGEMGRMEMMFVVTTEVVLNVRSND